MLPKKERLSRLEFNRFFSVGKRYHSPLFTLVYAPSPALHVSVVVSKKISNHAVVRNKIRRRIYDIVRHYRTETEVRGVFIFLTKKGVENTPYTSLKSEVYARLSTSIQNTSNMSTLL
ncbi:ribonuclease P protein component [Candidatus Kaiserbacteria bacterium]|nr:MAG: ribonuclease P protein component [Candidatus Kaiserbacteria bacterium]